METTTNELNGNVVTTTTVTTKTLGKYEFFCKGCKKVHSMSMYAVAQLASGNALVFTCDCGCKTDLKPFKDEEEDE